MVGGVSVIRAILIEGVIALIELGDKLPVKVKVCIGEITGYIDIHIHQAVYVGVIPDCV